MIIDIFLILIALFALCGQVYLVVKMNETFDNDWAEFYLGSCCCNLMWFQVLLYFLEMIAK